MMIKKDLCGRVQAHMGRLEVPITDYVGDTKSALDNSVRILQAITDVAADAGWLRTTLATMRIIQGLMQVCAGRVVSGFQFIRLLTCVQSGSSQPLV